MASSERLGYDRAQFYVWQAPGNELSIHLSLKVVEALAAENRRVLAEGPAPDIRGILLGRSILAPSPATFVEDFVLLPHSGDETGEYAGTASDDDLTAMVCRLHQGVEPGRIAVGFFRSEQDGSLIPGSRDLRTANRLFFQPDHVMLLIRFSRYKESEAAFFYRQNGKIQRRGFDNVFPFDADKLASRRAGRSDRAPLEWPGTPDRKGRAGAAKGPIRWWQLLPTAALFTLGTLVAQTALGNHTVTNPSAPAAITAAYESPLGLRVTSLPHQLQIRWNSDAQAIRSAARGELRISEGDIVVTEVIPMEKQQLLDGYVAYRPLTNDVSIRFEVEAPDGSRTSESIRAVGDARDF
jgi:hypothetical protein